MLVQSGGSYAAGSARETFVLSSILGYRKVSILAITNLNVTPMPSIKIQLNPIYSLGEFIWKNFNMAIMGSHIGYPNTNLTILNCDVAIKGEGNILSNKTCRLTG